MLIFPLLGVGFYSCITSLLSVGQIYSSNPSVSVFMYNSLLTSGFVVVAGYIGFFDYFKKGFDPVFIYKIVFPFALIALLVMCFHGAYTYKAFSMVVFLSHGMVYLCCIIYFLDLIAAGRLSVYVAWAAVGIIESALSLFGYLLGVGIGALNSMNYPSVLVSALMSVFILGMGLFIFSFRGRHEDVNSEQADVVSFGALYSLSPREVDVLTYLDEGLSAKDIAIALDLSENTIRGYMKSLYFKCDVHSKRELLDELSKAKKRVS